MQIGQGQIQRMFDIHSVHPSDELYVSMRRKSDSFSESNKTVDTE